MKQQSAGILLYRTRNKAFEVFLVHPGGPFWKNKDKGAWSIPKGEFSDDEEPLEAAKRELSEETGLSIDGHFIELTPVKQKSGKVIYAWGIETDFDPSTLKSNMFEMEWPPKSGRSSSFPEIDKGAWFNTNDALDKIIEGQRALIIELESILKSQ